MPPKPKFTREQVINAAYELAAESGIDTVVAREVAKKLNTTTTPIFTYFDSMDALKNEVRERAIIECAEYLRGSIKYYPAFKEFGLRWIRYAKNNPHLYSLIFFDKGSRTVFDKDISKELSDTRSLMIDEIVATFGINREDSGVLFDNMYIFAQGIASMIIFDVYDFPEEELSKRFTTISASYVAASKIMDGNLIEKQIKYMMDNSSRMPILKEEV